jgi:septal ring-binding cell division protein DamX
MSVAGSDNSDVFKRPERKSRAGWVLLVLLLSISVFGYLYKDWVLQEAELLKKYLLRGTPAAAAPEEAASAAAAAAAAASAASAEAMAAAELAASVAAPVASQAEAVASSATPAPSVPAVASVASVAAVPAVASEPLAANPDTTDSDQAWVNQLPENGFVVQLAAMDTLEDMRSFQRSNPAYAKARIMRTRQKDSGKRFYILVAGPFENKTQADTYMQSSPLLAKGWLRSTKSMKTQFTKS